MDSKMALEFEAADLEKKYYTISEVAQMFQVNTSLIRYWESEFELIRPAKDKNGERRFARKDIEELKVVYQLVKEKGYTLEGAKSALREEIEKAREKQQIVESLKKLRELLINIRNALP